MAPTVVPLPTSPATASAGQRPTLSTAPSSPAAGRTGGWQSDLLKLVPGLQHAQRDLDQLVSLADLQAAVDRLVAAVPNSTDDQLLVGLMRIVATVSARGCDGHLGAFVWGEGTYPVDSLPLRLWLFDEGVYIVDALPPYERLVGSRIDAMAGETIDRVLTSIEPIVPRDNAQTVRLLMPRFLLMPQVLRGLGIAGPGPVSLRLTAVDGTTSEVAVDPIAMADYNAWVGRYGLWLPADPDVLYLSRIGDALWWRRLDGGTLYVQYNRVELMSSSDLDQLHAALTDPQTESVVFDVRLNYGGEVSAIEPILRELSAPEVDRPGRLFLVTGRNTFSAASLLVARLDRDTSAVIVGEPMGGCPTAWGNSRTLELPYTGIAVSIPTQLEVGVSADDPRLTIEPDLPARLTPRDWAAGADPALVAIADYRP
jgi:hypothetical protein